MATADGKGAGPSIVHRGKVSLASSDLGNHTGKNPAVGAHQPLLWLQQDPVMT